MTFLEYWSALLVPEGGFHPHDLWQLAVVILFFSLSSKVLGKRANTIDIKDILIGEVWVCRLAAPVVACHLRSAGWSRRQG